HACAIACHKTKLITTSYIADLQLPQGPAQPDLLSDAANVRAYEMPPWVLDNQVGDTAVHHGLLQFASSALRNNRRTARTLVAGTGVLPDSLDLVASPRQQIANRSDRRVSKSDRRRCNWTYNLTDERKSVHHACSD